jgi:hypothetical protein
MHAELGTDPGFHYLYGKANDPEPEPSRPATDAALTGGHLRTRGVEPSQQQHWDWKAAGNFVCGGTAAGCSFTAIASLRYDELAARLGCLGFVALGLFLVLLKIGGRCGSSMSCTSRNARGWHVKPG